MIIIYNGKQIDFDEVGNPCETVYLDDCTYIHSIIQKKAPHYRGVMSVLQLFKKRPVYGLDGIVLAEFKGENPPQKITTNLVDIGKF